MTLSLYAVGRVVKVFGLKGEIVIESMTSSPDRFETLGHVFVGWTDKEVEAMEVEYVRVEKRGVRIKLSAAHNRTDAERLVGRYIFVSEKNRVQLPGGTFFVDDVVGLFVVDEIDNHLGVVKAVMKLPAQDVYVIDSNGREILVPAIREFIRDINLQTRKMTVRLIEGFLEER